MTRKDLLEKVAYIQSKSSLDTKVKGNVSKALEPKKPTLDTGKVKMSKPVTPEKPKSLPEVKAPKAPKKVPSLGSSTFGKFKGSNVD